MGTLVTVAAGPVGDAPGRWWTRGGTPGDPQAGDFRQRLQAGAPQAVLEGGFGNDGCTGPQEYVDRREERLQGQMFRQFAQSTFEFPQPCV